MTDTSEEDTEKLIFEGRKRGISFSEHLDVAEDKEEQEPLFEQLTWIFQTFSERQYELQLFTKIVKGHMWGFSVEDDLVPVECVPIDIFSQDTRDTTCIVVTPRNVKYPSEGVITPSKGSTIMIKCSSDKNRALWLEEISRSMEHPNQEIETPDMKQIFEMDRVGAQSQVSLIPSDIEERLQDDLVRILTDTESMIVDIGKRSDLKLELELLREIGGGSDEVQRMAGMARKQLNAENLKEELSYSINYDELEVQMEEVKRTTTQLQSYCSFSKEIEYDCLVANKLWKDLQKIISETKGRRETAKRRKQEEDERIEKLKLEELKLREEKRLEEETRKIEQERKKLLQKKKEEEKRRKEEEEERLKLDQIKKREAEAEEQKHIDLESSKMRNTSIKLEEELEQEVESENSERRERLSIERSVSRLDFVRKSDSDNCKTEIIEVEEPSLLDKRMIKESLQPLDIQTTEEEEESNNFLLVHKSEESDQDEKEVRRRRIEEFRRRRSPMSSKISPNDVLFLLNTPSRRSQSAQPSFKRPRSPTRSVRNTDGEEETYPATFRLSQDTDEDFQLSMRDDKEMIDRIEFNFVTENDDFVPTHHLDLTTITPVKAKRSQPPPKESAKKLLDGIKKEMKKQDDVLLSRDDNFQVYKTIDSSSLKVYRSPNHIKQRISPNKYGMNTPSKTPNSLQMTPRPTKPSPSDSLFSPLNLSKIQITPTKLIHIQKMLKTGHVFWKHSSSGISKKKLQHVFLSQDSQYLCYVKPDLKKGNPLLQTVKNKLPVSSIRYVQRNGGAVKIRRQAETKNFLSATILGIRKDEAKVNADCLFSIVTDDRTLDLEAATPDVAQLWAEVFEKYFNTINSSSDTLTQFNTTHIIHHHLK